MVGRVLTLAATIAIAVGPGADAENAARPMYVNLKWRPFARASGPEAGPARIAGGRRRDVGGDGEGGDNAVQAAAC